MERDEVAVLGRDVGGVVGGGKSAESFIDRSKVRILLCDNDPKSSEEVLTLLCKCSYQVTSVKSARQVIDALNAEGPDIDIILAEVDLPMAKGMKMLKYIMRDKELRRIPVIMMSAQDEVSVVVKCLRLGAADYLVKPLRTNELLNLWTHMWRRRRMLGLVEKNLTNYDIDLVASDPSDANTNSATLFSDDTDERSRKSAIQVHCISTDDQEDEINEVQRQVMSNAGTTAAPWGLPPMFTRDHRPDVPGISDRRTGQFASCPKKSELRIGESSSAFFTYVKSSIPRSSTQVVSPGDEINTRTDNPPYFWAGQARLDSQGSDNREAMQVNSDTQGFDKRESKDSLSQGDVLPRSNSIPDSFSMERSATPPTMMEYQQQGGNSKMEEFSRMQQMHRSNVSHHHQDVSGFHRHPGYPFYVPGMINQVMMSQGQMFQKPPQDMPPSMFPQYGHLQHVPGMAPFPYYPVNMCMMQQQQGHMPPNQPWAPSYGNPSSAPEGWQPGKIDRRVAALMKFRQKRKERCFDKKIRYVNRKKLAERRPRVRGQFVRKMNGIDVDLNGEPAFADFDEDEEDDEELAARDDSPDDDASMGCL